MADRLTERRDFAEQTALRAGALGLEFQQKLGTLEVESKGPQDFVTEADRAVERLIRDAIAETFPDDAIVGEEYGAADGLSGFTWVIDPIDGTANFVAGLPLWCVSIAGFAEGRSQVGAIHAPVTRDTYVAALGMGTKVNGKTTKVRDEVDFSKGAIGIGFPGGSKGAIAAREVLKFCDLLVDEGGVFVRPASGAILLADVAAGRLIGGAEPLMNSWDCLAGLILIEEAGGRIEPYDGDTVLAEGAAIVVAGPRLFEPLRALAAKSFASLD